MKTAEEIILLPSKSESEIVADDLYLTEMTQRLQKLRSLLEKAESKTNSKSRRKKSAKSRRH